MTTKIDPSMTFTVPIAVINTNHSDIQYNTFMDGICHGMTINQIKEHFVKLHRAEDIDYSERNISIVIEGKHTSGEDKCEYYNIDSSTCLEFNIN